MSEKKTQPIFFRLPYDIYLEFKKLCNENGKKMCWVAQQGVLEFMNKSRSGLSENRKEDN